MASRWSFEERRPKGMLRDPFEAEFFTGEEDSEDVYGRTDALVREAIQNSMDARDPGYDGPVRVRFCLSLPEDAVPPADATGLLDGLVPHLDALGNELVNTSLPCPAMPYLVVEDFGTRGLCGDPGWNRIMPPDDEAAADFYWFWRNVGRSGKGGTDRGRWGLGKTVFPATSKINAMFGLTVRTDDGRQLLMGQAITKVHMLSDKEYDPEGFFCDPDASDQLQMPLESKEIIESFRTVFKLDRKDEPGLSVVVPYPFDRIGSQGLVRSAIVHFFYPILKRELVVEVSGPGGDKVIIAADTIRDVAAGFEWDGRPHDKKHVVPPFDLACWASASQREEKLVCVKAPENNVSPTWTEALFEEGQLDHLRSEFAAGSRIALRIPMRILRKDGAVEATHFDIFVEHDYDLPRGEDHFVREGMTISKMATLQGQRGVRGLLVVEDKSLSALLGDAEGPAHTNWGTGEARPDRHYVKWKRRVGFVKNGIAKLLALLAPPPEGLDEDWLQDIFAIDDPKKSGPKRKRKRRRRGESDPPPIPPLPVRPLLFVMTERAGGFRIKGLGDSAALPSRIILSAAYDLSDGNPFKSYSPIDFRFDDGDTGALSFAHNGLRFEARTGNQLILIPESPDFELEVTGFDTTRDVIVRANAEVAEDD